MKRRTFIASSLALAGLGPAVAGCKAPKPVGGRIAGASASVGHLLRSGHFGTPATTIQKEVVIAGAGISGLSAGRWLQRQGITDFAILDLEAAPGGNAAHGANGVSAYPWGAHYVPVPNNNLTEYIEFLTEAGVVTGRDNRNLPVYNEYHLCFHPQDRLYINGRWQEGLVPEFGVPRADGQQIDRFLSLMEDFRHQKGKDGRDAFAIPVDASSKDEAFTGLDDVTMKAWMTAQGFTSGYLHWYVDYCTRDDFGTAHGEVSAWAGIHYFASRKGQGANAAHDDVLTWPEGNGFLVTHLAKNIQPQIRCGALVTNIQKTGRSVWVDYLDVASKTLHRIICRQCIVAVPQFVAARLLHSEERAMMVNNYYRYAPWMVANLTVAPLEERSGAAPGWDNVLYGSKSLGYVNATHQLLQQHLPLRNITYYLPLAATPEARRQAQHTTHEAWVKSIMADLKKVHPNIAAATKEVNVMIWGHAMVQPLPGLIHGPVRQSLAASINEAIHFAHTDLAGISIFEEGFYQGIAAAQKVAHHIKATA